MARAAHTRLHEVMMRYFNTLLLLALATSFVSTAKATTLEGTVTIPAELTQSPPKEGTLYMHRKIAVAPAYDDGVRPVVFISGLKNADDTKPSEFAPLHFDRLGIKDNNFWLLHGSELEIISDDTIPLTLKVSDGESLEEKITIEPGKPFKYKPKSPGTLEISIADRPYEKAYVLVTTYHYTIKVNNNGTFFLDDLPPGKATVNVWHNGEIISAMTIDIEDEGIVGVVFVPDANGTLNGQPTATRLKRR